MKLQEAYATENNKVGTWVDIGYKGPGSNAAAGSSSKSSMFTYAGEDAGEWVATTTVDLNDCPKDATWSVSTDYTNGAITIEAEISDDNCNTPLTPNFCKIATSGSCKS